MSYYSDVYLKRLNRYGNNYQDRVQGEREHAFDLYLLKSVYQVSFTYNNQTIVGSFERYQQDNTRTLHYLLVNIDVNFNSGTILSIPNKDNVNEYWMVYYLEDIKASGYNRYIMIRLSHNLSWVDRDGTTRTQRCYLWGPHTSGVDPTTISNKTDVVYTEIDKYYHVIMPYITTFKLNDYMDVGDDSFVVVGLDSQSTNGILYVTLDPVSKRDLTPAPTPQSGDKETDYYWLEQGDPEIPEV